MAQIVPSKLHPDEEVHYSLAGGEFTLGPDGSYDTDDPVLVLNAYAHPWLDVEVPRPAGVPVVDKTRTLDPRKDVLAAAHGTDAFDPVKIAELEASKVAAFAAPVAVDSGLDQDKKVIEAGVAHTLAAEPVVVERVTKREEKARQDAISAFRDEEKARAAAETKGDN